MLLFTVIGKLFAGSLLCTVCIMAVLYTVGLLLLLPLMLYPYLNWWSAANGTLVLASACLSL